MQTSWHLTLSILACISNKKDILTHSHLDLSCIWKLKQLLSSLWYKLFKKIFIYFWPHLEACEIFIPQTGIEPMSPAVEVWSLTTGLPEKSLIPALESSFSQNQPRFIYYTWLYLCNSRMSYSSQHFPQYVDLLVRPVILQEVPPLSIHFLLGHLAHFSVTGASCKPKVRSKFWLHKY